MRAAPHDSEWQAEVNRFLLEVTVEECFCRMHIGTAERSLDRLVRAGYVREIVGAHRREAKMDCPKCGYAMTPLDEDCPKCKRLARVGDESPGHTPKPLGQGPCAQGPPPAASHQRRDWPGLWAVLHRPLPEGKPESVRRAWAAGAVVAGAIIVLSLAWLLVPGLPSGRPATAEPTPLRAAAPPQAQPAGMGDVPSDSAVPGPAPAVPRDYGVIILRVGDAREVALWPSYRLPVGGTVVAVWISLTNNSSHPLWVFESAFSADICGSLCRPLHYPESTPVDEGVARGMFLYPIPDFPGTWGRQIAVGETASGYLYFAPAGSGCGKATLEANLRTHGARVEIVRG